MSAPPVDVRPLFAPLGEELVALLRRLEPEAWQRMATPRWRVRDVAAHLLDGNVRRLSFHRDALPPIPPDRAIGGFPDLVGFLDGLNADWIRASARLSPRLLTELLDVTNRWFAEFAGAVDPRAPALFPVAWAGEDGETMWLDLGREYTERWHHQQQIRDAVGRPALDAPRWLLPVLRVGVRSLPRAWSAVEAPDGTSVQLHVRGGSGGDWFLARDAGRWHLHEGTARDPSATIDTDADTAWRLWHKAIDPARAAERIRFTGRTELARPFLDTLAVMA